MKRASQHVHYRENQTTKMIRLGTEVPDDHPAVRAEPESFIDVLVEPQKNKVPEPAPESVSWLRRLLSR